MSSSDPVIVCSTAGVELGDKRIIVYDASILSLANKFSKIALAAVVGEHKANEFADLYESSYEDMHKWLTKHGVPNVKHAPHQQNFAP